MLISSFDQRALALSLRTLPRCAGGRSMSSFERIRPLLPPPPALTLIADGAGSSMSAAELWVLLWSLSTTGESGAGATIAEMRFAPCWPVSCYSIQLTRSTVLLDRSRKRANLASTWWAGYYMCQQSRFFLVIICEAL